ncbi:MAG: hypothetical protein ACOC6B_03735 [Thermodesulfobacteriota bacterium]
MLRPKSGQLYIGSITDVEQRYKDHCSGKACRTTELHANTSFHGHHHFSLKCGV